MTDYTIANEYELPSKGQLYSQDVKSYVKLRSMTTAEEMKRLNHSDRPYSSMAEIIDDCMVEPIGISSYDLCIPDYQFLLHKLRIVTYGPNYKVETTCPWCKTPAKSTVNLEALYLTEFDKELYDKYSEFDLPVTKKRIKLRMQTPRILDDIYTKTKDERRKNPGMTGDPAFLFTLEALIDEIDGRKPEQFKIVPFIQKLPMADTNYILKAAQKINNSFGLESSFMHVCPTCGLDYTSNFRTTSEFFGPSID